MVSKGGNFLLNIGPNEKGDFDKTAYDRLKKIGEWMKINSEAIYYTRPVEPYKEGKVCFTKLKDGTVFAIYLADENESSLPEKLIFEKFIPSSDAEIELLGTGIKLKGKKNNNFYEIEFPENVRKNIPNKYAWVLKIK